MNGSSLWPYVEANKINARKDIDKKDTVIFETGYGPSGLPHIGTFGEVVRTNWVRTAFEQLTGKKTKLITFSDDMDALRKVPDNVPNQDILRDSIGLPLTKVPNPFSTNHSSFADHNNAMLCSFINNTGIDFEFASSTDYYSSGRFNDGLYQMALKHDEIVAAVVPTLRTARSESWSPFMPIHPISGHVQMTKIHSVDAERGFITWKDEEGMTFETSIYDGKCKIQWKADWALRWYVLGVDYEMSGKDLIDSVKLSSKICRILGGNPPINLTYELFLDAQGQKISKSKGNGLSYEQWVEISSTSALELFMFNNPTRAKKISPEIAISSEEEYIKLNNKYYANIDAPEENINNPVGQFINKQPSIIDVSYGLILNIVSATSATSSDEIMSYLNKYRPNIDITDDYLNYMIYSALNYYYSYIEPTKVYREPTDIERVYMNKLIDIYSNYNDEHSEERYQYWAFEIGKESNMNLRDWFKSLYEVFLGQSQGPRFGVFVAGYGIDNTVNLMKSKLQ